MHDLYYNTKQYTAYGSAYLLYKAAKKIYPNITENNVKKWLLKQDIFSLHAPVRKHFKRRKTLAKGLYYQMQMDLVDMRKFKGKNRNYMYLLTAIDVFNRKGFAIPIRSKSNEHVLEGLKKLFADYPYVKKIQTDQGTEFFGHKVREYMKRHNMHHFFTSSDTKSSLVERFNRTLKNRMFKYFTANKTTHYLDVIEDLVKAYNNRKHRSIGMAPNQVTPTNERKVWDYQYGSYVKGQYNVKFKYNVGDIVRISTKANQFKKGYLPNYNEEYFTVHQRTPSSPPTYKLIDQKGDVIIGSFYEQELHRVIPVEGKYIVIKRRKRKGIKESLIHYIGKPEDDQEWIPDKILNKNQ